MGGAAEGKPKIKKGKKNHRRRASPARDLPPTSPSFISPASSTPAPPSDPVGLDANIIPPSKTNAAPRGPRHRNCKHRRQYRFEQDASLWSWKEGKEAQMITSSWAEFSGTNWTLRPQAVVFLNNFLALQDNTFCRTPDKKQKLLLIRRDNGLGNSLQASIAYMVMAALTERAVVFVGWGDGLHEIFDSPLEAYTFESLKRHDLVGESMLKAFYDCKPTADMECHGISGDDQWMWCDPIKKKFKKRVVSIVGCCGNFLQLMRRNPRYGPILHDLFGDHELAIPLYRTLLRPSKKIVEALEEDRSEGPYIAVQVRSFQETMSQHLLDTFAGCLKHIMMQSKYKDARVYVAAVNMRLIKRLKDRLKGVTVFHHKPPGAEIHATRAWVGAVQDMWALAQADELILSPWSTFGTLASTWSSAVPWEVEGSMSTITGTCRRILSGEPCCMRNWGPVPDSCPPGKEKPMKLPSGLNRLCQFDNANSAGKDGSWKGVHVKDKEN